MRHDHFSKRTFIKLQIGFCSWHRFRSGDTRPTVMECINDPTAETRVRSKLRPDGRADRKPCLNTHRRCRRTLVQSDS